MRNSYLRLAGYAAICAGVTMMVAGWAVAGELGSMVTGYGLLFVLCGAYMWAGLAIRDRVRASTASRERPVERQTLLGRRVF